MTTTEQNGNGKAMQKMSDQPANNRAALQQVLVSRQDEIKRLVGSVMSPERLVSLALLTVGQSPYLAKCSLSSVVGSVLAAARMGLEIDGVHAAMVPMRAKDGGWQAQCWPMFRGLLARAYDDKDVQEITARAVYDGEHFAVHYGTNDSIEHTPDADAVATGNVVAVYAVIHMRGRAKFEVMWRSEVDAIMARSPSIRASTHSPWKTDYVQMALKTVLKRITKTAPLKSQRLFAALATDDDNDATEVIDVAMEEAPLDEKPPEKPKRAAAMKEKLAATAPPATEPPKPTVDAEPKMITDAQRNRILALCDKAGKTTPAQRLEMVGGLLGIDIAALGTLTEAQAAEVIDIMSGAREMRKQEAERAAAGDDDPSLGVDR